MCINYNETLSINQANYLERAELAYPLISEFECYFKDFNLSKLMNRLLLGGFLV